MVVALGSKHCEYVLSGTYSQLHEHSKLCVNRKRQNHFELMENYLDFSFVEFLCLDNDEYLQQ